MKGGQEDLDRERRVRGLGAHVLGLPVAGERGLSTGLSSSSACGREGARRLLRAPVRLHGGE